MNPDAPLPLLGGLSPTRFMRTHWQKKPLLVRQAWPGVTPPLSRAAMVELAASDDVESRLVVHRPKGWTVRHGPLSKRHFPPLREPGWTLLVQGVDLHVPAAHSMLSSFRFVPAARLDDLMVSWASDGGGVGAHVDAYDVFLLQVEGRRRWRVGRARDKSFVEGLPLRVLQNFEPEHEWVLDPGDMLYLPPNWGHDGVAEGSCMTCSIGFRSPSIGELARDLLPRLADDAEEGGRRYGDAGTPASTRPGEIPVGLQHFARAALQRALDEVDATERALGESLTEPKPHVWFAAGRDRLATEGISLDLRTRMLYDARHVFINGEAFEARGRDARLMRALADERRLDPAACRGLSVGARALLDDWLRAGWVRPEEAAP